MRTLRNTILTVTAIAAMSLPAQAVAAPDHSFAGSCDVLGRTLTTNDGMFAQYETYKASGTCTGSLDAAARKTYQVRVRTFAKLPMIQGPSVDGSGQISFVGTRKQMHWRFTRHAGGVLDIRGSQATRATGLRTSKPAYTYGISIQAPTALYG